MKKLFAWLLSCLFCFFAGASYAQGEVTFTVAGRDKGAVDAMEVNGVMYVNLQKTARKLGAEIELFAQSKQAKVTAKGFYAILTVPLKEIIVNARPKTLKAPIIINGSKMMAPVEFFLLPDFQKAVGKTISYQKKSFTVERPFDFQRTENKLNKQDSLIVFDPQKKITWTTSQPNKHTVLVTFPNATVKRDEFFRLKTDYIASADIRQSRDNAVLKVILGKDANVWSFTEQQGKLVFRAGAKKADPILTPEKPTVLTPEPQKELENKASSLKGPSEVSPKPSVLSEDDGFIEMFAEEKPTPVIAPVPEEEGGSSQPVKTTPVIKTEPHPLAVKPAHKKMRIMVDPGHGGKDPGAVRSRYYEKNWNLDVSKELVRLLKKGGFEVKMTREDDSFTSLSGRSKASNNFKADLFVSIHANASKNRRAHGFQVYFRSEKATDEEAEEVAALENEAMQYEEVHYNFVDALLQSLAKNEYINESSKVAGYVRNAVYKQPGIGIAVSQNSSVRQANFYVLKGVQSPAILVEMGYMSYPKDRDRLANATVRKRMAQGIYNGIYNYAKKEGWIK